MSKPSHFDSSIIFELRKSGLTWTRVAEVLWTNTTCLLRWRQRNNYEDNFIIPSEASLDDLVSNYLETHPNCGEVMTMGYLRSQNIRVTREALRASINRVDRSGRIHRKRRAIKRRVYKVPGPHYLWHIDGCHKMIRYGLVVHGCIDGFSRFVTYLQCSNNNLSSTVGHLFDRAILEHGSPSHIRIDGGVENRAVVLRMLFERGIDRRSVLVGPSVHNQRIERFWRDCRTCILSYYLSIFERLEVEVGMDIGNVAHKFILQHLFLDCINEDLDLFVKTWNNHSLRTERGALGDNWVVILGKMCRALKCYVDLKV